jgi:hypothetical protein
MTQRIKLLIGLACFVVNLLVFLTGIWLIILSFPFIGQGDATLVLEDLGEITGVNGHLVALALGVGLVFVAAMYTHKARYEALKEETPAIPDIIRHHAPRRLRTTRELTIKENTRLSDVAAFLKPGFSTKMSQDTRWSEIEEEYRGTGVIGEARRGSDLAILPKNTRVRAVYLRDGGGDVIRWGSDSMNQAVRRSDHEYLACYEGDDLRGSRSGYILLTSDGRLIVED